MWNEVETQYNPQMGVRRSLFSKEYDFMTNIAGIEADAHSCRINLHTWQGQIATVEVSFITNTAFRFVMLPPGTEVDARATVVHCDELRKPIQNVRFSENDESFIYETDEVSIQFCKAYWEMSVYQNGRLLTKEAVFDTNVDNRWKQLPLGFKVDETGRYTEVFEQMKIYSDEQFWGFGEKFTQFNKRGQKINIWQKDALSTNTEDSYKGHPYFMSSRGYAILLNSYAKSAFDMGASSWVSYQMKLYDQALDFIFMAQSDKDYAKLIRQYQDMFGTIPMLPEWAFGFWMSKCSYICREEVEQIAADAEKNGIKIDVIHIDGWQKPGMDGLWVWDEERYPDPEGIIRGLNEKGIHLSVWNYPYLSELSPEFEKLSGKDYFVKGLDGKPAMFKATADSENLCAAFDFTNPEVVEWYKQMVEKIVEMGVSVIKNDFSEAVPEDVIYHNGLIGRQGHNLYTYLYAKTIYEAMDKVCRARGELPMLWGRSGFSGNHCFPAAWAGDSSCEVANHSAILQAGLGMAMSGVSFWGYDLGGFYNTNSVGNESRPDVETYLHSMQLGLWMPLSRAHGKSPREPWNYGEYALERLREWIDFRHELWPYLYKSAVQSHETGMPMLRPLALMYPQDPAAVQQNLIYMLGDDLLVIPQFDMDTFTYYLPEGKWQDIFTKEILEGKQYMEVCATRLTEGGNAVRILQKAGSNVPLRHGQICFMTESQNIAL